METMKVETIAKEIIKPSSTTPNDLQTLQLSIYDHILPPVYTVAFLFYTKDDLISPEQSSHKLKTSLAETLTKFYPLAGRIKGVTIDCNDEGAVFVDARVNNYPLSDFLRSPDFKTLQQLLPLDVIDDPYEAATTWPLLLVKATYFPCGGMAIGLCITHKIADATSISTFIQSWAAMARGEAGDIVADPVFAAANFYPPANELFKFPVDENANKISQITKRFVFSASKLEELRTKAASEDFVGRPTRVESVTALLWKAFVAAASSNTNACDMKLSYETHEPYTVSSWCKLPLYEASFGWGSPVWIAGNVAPMLENVTMLIDSKDGQGIEAFVTLPEENMLSLEQNTELLAFASVNPSVLV
ncbi:Transferase [Arabidopsis thaliana x Arabidopsis arenosa]|uniref:Transferase n=1 Tax=Arabidopsis thaliana x Arabidopsis arenosa TaxID=1240361 RepID=A0A8T2EUF0_9BRAS|nr:Transferase [Arabidopsis thaliana x Arabidopsis arenosa]